MFDHEGSKMVLVILRISSDEESAKSRVKNVVPHAMKAIKSIESEAGQLVFTDNDGVTLGYVFITSNPLHVVRSVITKAQGWSVYDSCLILELTDGFTGVGFSKAWTWMQHRMKHIDQ